MRTLSEAARCALALRGILKKQYPNTVFRITSENFSMGNSVNISYVGRIPALREVEKIVAPYKDGQFNGMEDIYEYHKANGLPRAKYIHVNRRTDPKDRESIIVKYGLIDDQDTMTRFRCYMEQFIWREDCEASANTALSI